MDIVYQRAKSEYFDRIILPIVQKSGQLRHPALQPFDLVFIASKEPPPLQRQLRELLCASFLDKTSDLWPVE